MGWSPLRNLRRIKNVRQAFRRAFVKVNSGLPPRLIARRVAELYNFVHGMKIGDYVVCVSKSEGAVRVGRVIGDYQYIYVKRLHPHTREVRWRDQVRTLDTLPASVRRALKAGRLLYKPKHFKNDVRTELLP